MDAEPQPRLPSTASGSSDEPEDWRDPEYRARHKHEIGRRLMTNLIDDRARRNYSVPAYAIPVSTDPKDGYRDISYRQFAKAIDRCAWWIKEQMSTSEQLETVVYVGAFDLRYQIVAMAGVKTGHVMFLISPRNSLEIQLALLDNVKATKIIISADSTTEATVKPILNERPLQKFVIPELDYFLEDVHVDPMPFKGTFDEYRMKPWILLHTSGSTGIPKIITIRHGYATVHDSYWLSPNGNELYERINHQRLFLPFPPYHMGGIIGPTSMCIYVEGTCVLPPQTPLSSEVVNDIHIAARVNFSMIPPAIIVGLAKNEEYLDNLKKLNGITYGGGPLPPETGNLVVKYTEIHTNYGSTETLAIPLLKKPRQYWNYMRFDMDFSGAQLKQVDDTDLYEAVIVRDPKFDLIQAIFVTFPELDEFRTKDLFSKHPTEPGLWKYESRLDDVIVLNNAEKINPVDMEGTITTSPEVTGALVVGQARFQTALLVEVQTPPETEEEKKKLLDAIWPYVKTANDRSPTYARISRDLIMLLDPNKPFSRAGKGTIQRQQNVKLYKQEIDELYEAYESRKTSELSGSVNFQDTDATEKFLHEWVLQETRLGEVEGNQDLFNSGMDSLVAANLVRHINMCSSDRQIGVKEVYSNPTITRLAQSLAKSPDAVREGDEDNETWAMMEQVFNNLKASPFQKRENVIEKIVEKVTEVVTIST